MITIDQPLKIMSMPTSRPITHGASPGHRAKMITPNSNATIPLNNSQYQFGVERSGNARVAVELATRCNRFSRLPKERRQGIA